MNWRVKTGNLLDEPADVLVCPANVSLNLSGGVGAELLERYGREQQAELHRQIADRQPRVARQGEVFATTLPSMPYRAVLHAVAVDPLYHSSSAIVKNLVRDCLLQAAARGAVNVTLAALGTGYGDLTLAQFAEGLKKLWQEDFAPVKTVTICLVETERAEELRTALFPISGLSY